jgi:hypothetical protein
MLKEVEACAFLAPSRQRKKKKGQLLYSTPKVLNTSRMQRSNVVQRFIPEHVNTTRALDFQGTNLAEIPCTSTSIMPNVEEEAQGDDADIGEESDDQVSSELEVAFSILIKHASELES